MDYFFLNEFRSFHGRSHSPSEAVRDFLSPASIIARPLPVGGMYMDTEHEGDDKTYIYGPTCEDVLQR